MSTIQTSLSHFQTTHKSFFDTKKSQGATQESHTCEVTLALETLRNAYDQANLDPAFRLSSVGIQLEKIERRWKRCCIDLSKTDLDTLSKLSTKIQTACSNCTSILSAPVSDQKTLSQKVLSLFEQNKALEQKIMKKILSKGANDVATKYTRSMPGLQRFLKRIESGCYGEQLRQMLFDEASSFLYDCSQLLRLLFIDCIIRSENPTEQIGWFKKCDKSEVDRVWQQGQTFMQTLQSTSPVTIRPQDLFYLFAKQKPQIPQDLLTNINQIAAKSRLENTEYNCVLEHVQLYVQPSSTLIRKIVQYLEEKGCMLVRILRCGQYFFFK